MEPLKSTKDQSLFVQAALALDSDFAELERLSGQLERLPIESDSGLEQARKALTRFSECGSRIGEGVKILAKELEDSRSRAERAAQIVSERAVAIQKRFEQTEQMLARFRSLGEMAGKINAAVVQLQKPTQSGELSAEEKALLAKHMPEIDSNLAILLDETRKLREDAGAVNMKALEREADSMAQSLQSVRQKLSSMNPRPHLVN
ncbi:MAG: hypothetical protein AB1540_11420 [Bdellovibrionota bacterium]